MQYYRCPGCGLTTPSVTGRFTPNICANCSSPLRGEDRVEVEERHPPVIERRFTRELHSAAAARRELETLSWTLGFEESRDLALLVTELIANRAQRGAGADGGVALEVSVTEALVRVRVWDDPDGFVAPAGPDGSPLDSLWSVYLLDQLADRWEVTADPSPAVSFEIDRAPLAGVDSILEPSAFEQPMELRQSRARP